MKKSRLGERMENLLKLGQSKREERHENIRSILILIGVVLVMGLMSHLL